MNLKKIVGANLNKPPIKVKHADLEKLHEDSRFKVVCPKCEAGLLGVHRNKDFTLSRHDRCVMCAQTFTYIDDKIDGEKLEEMKEDTK